MIKIAAAWCSRYFKSLSAGYKQFGRRRNSAALPSGLSLLFSDDVEVRI